MRVTVLRRREAMTLPRRLDGINETADIMDIDALPQCEAQRAGRYHRDYEARHPDKQCTRRARYDVDGVKLCSLHAGEVALHYLVNHKGEPDDKA